MKLLCVAIFVIVCRFLEGCRKNSDCSTGFCDGGRIWPFPTGRCVPKVSYMLFITHQESLISPIFAKFLLFRFFTTKISITCSLAVDSRSAETFSWRAKTSFHDKFNKFCLPNDHVLSTIPIQQSKVILQLASAKDISTSRYKKNPDGLPDASFIHEYLLVLPGQKIARMKLQI